MPAILKVNLTAVAKNYNLLKAAFSGAETAAVVKADGYGLGAEMVAKKLSDEGCKTFFVANIDEAIALRSALPNIRIIVFHGAQSGEEKTFIEHGLTPVINTIEAASAWSKASDEPAVLHIDTGMSRLGVNENEAKNLSGNFSIVMSHLSCANTPGHEKNAQQLARFAEVANYFPDAKKSLCNSAGIFLSEKLHFDIARPGCALYGINPGDYEENKMHHVATWSAPILQIRELDRDETIGYGATCLFPKGSKIAILEVGYADGYLRSLGNRGTVFFADEAAAVVGRVSMDMIAVDVSHLPAAKITQYADILCEHQKVDDLAAQCGTIGYEVLTNIGARVRREYS